MKKMHIAILAALVSLSGGPVAHAAQFTGKVTQPNGITPVANEYVYLYKFNPANGSYNYDSYTYTSATGAFTAVASGVGVYYITFGRSSSSSDFISLYYGNDPFISNSSYYFYDPLGFYYNETYDDVTELSPPTKAPTTLIVSTPAQSTALKPVVLNRKTKGCMISGPITINGVPYSSFFIYSGMGPALPPAGGILNISFKVINLSASPITTAVQPLAFLTQQNTAAPAVKNNRGVASGGVGKIVTFPANAITPVSLTATIPASFMSVSPPPSTVKQWAFNIGINATAGGVPNCFSMVTFPVLKNKLASAVALEEQTPEMVREETPQMIIPLTLSKDGEPLTWGQVPE
jgi:hypothetical protein